AGRPGSRSRRSPAPRRWACTRESASRPRWAGWGRVAPNPLVGAVVVNGGEVVGEGYHTEYGRPHAEVEALRAAGEAARGATLYVTLEPCAHHGKTPPCTDAILAAGVRRVVFAASDPNPKAAGGCALLEGAGVEVVRGVELRAALDLNAAFFHALAGPERPWTELKLALSLDARVADRDGRSVWITGDLAREEVHRMRAGFDAVGVGIGTALADDPKLTVRGPVEPRVPLTRVVFDRALRLPADGHLARTAREVPVALVSRPDAPGERRAALEALGVRVLAAETLADGLRELRRAGVSSLFCEGGAALSAALLEAGLVDRLHLFYAPLFLGPEGASPFAGIASPAVGEAKRWRRLRTEAFGPDTLVTLAAE
ncbi:MAG TPA: bifunctional diaminohydroxyphosphoribosylaminopyrimidine deaminase/5-amino-6-(5-phosphoribosylamino)uracil reductase RibD, partial [Longimicrobiaceae bacterium]|nr:bifunctional diaminohydroxyphosphoribosylaminopyrimidine deaminase/5-amino-6-(5-phosphoribosylamino)uracil reductase RibD [Longimicrobiaceae bacterium]